MQHRAATKEVTLHVPYIKNNRLSYSSVSKSSHWRLEPCVLVSNSSRENRIVVDSPKDRLVLTAIRSHRTGEYTPYDEKIQITRNYNIDVVKALLEPVKDIEKTVFTNQAEASVDEEGYVVRFVDGQMYKVKAEMYFKQHRAKDGFDKEKAVVEMILAGNLIDDLLPSLKQTDREALLGFQDAIMIVIQQAADKVEIIIAEAKVAPNDDKRRFATEFVKSPQCADFESKLLFDVWKGVDPVEVIKMAILRNIGKEGEAGSSWREQCMGVHTWQTFRDATTASGGQAKTTNTEEKIKIYESFF